MIYVYMYMGCDIFGFKTSKNQPSYKYNMRYDVISWDAFNQHNDIWVDPRIRDSRDTKKNIEKKDTGFIVLKATWDATSHKSPLGPSNQHF